MSRLALGVLLGALLAAVPTRGSPPEEPYQEILVRVPPGSSPAQILQDRDLELVGVGEGEIRLVSRPHITTELTDQGLSVKIVHGDLEAFYAERQGKVADYGVWHTYAETAAELESIHAQYPAITTAPFSLGQSVEGREIWAIKVSDNPEVDEEEPEVLYDGVHHAREIMTVELCLFILRHLCENYQTDRLATTLVDERQIYFVPIVNPDGFVYNEMQAPNGGGMWRKNRRDDGVGCQGVDLNRNYPYMWGGAGSSANRCEDIYRGPSPGSEPETQAMVRFMNGRRFVTHESIHSFMGAILYPWGYSGQPTSDDDLFHRIGAARASVNGYAVARIGVSGCASDYAYGEQTAKPKIMSFLTEIGGSGFWPDPSEKEGLLQENLHSMLTLALVAGPSLETESFSLVDEGGDRRIEPGETFGMTARIVNQGLLTGSRDFRVVLRCDDPYVRLLAAADSVEGLAPGGMWENTDHPFRCRIEEGCPQGRRVDFTLAVDAGASGQAEMPLTIQVGEAPAIFAVDFEEGREGWLVDPSQTTTEGSFQWIDPNPTAYQPGDDTTPAPGSLALITGQNETESEHDVDGGITAVRSRDLDLSAYPRVRLSVNYFFGQRDGGDDPTGDWFRIEVSSDAGGSWVTLLEIGDQRSLPVWRNLSVDLEEVIDLTDRVRFRVRASDGPEESDIIEGGIDDFLLTLPGTDSRPPSAPEALAPVPGPGEQPPRPVLVVANAVDPDGDPLRYGFVLFADRDQTTPLLSADGIAEGRDGTTSWAVPIPLDPGTYTWRAYAADLRQRGLYGRVAELVVSSTPSPAYAEAVHLEPNPAQRQSRILYFLPKSLISRVMVFDAQGRRVRSLPGPSAAAGWQTIDWDCRDDEGRLVPSGSYWVRVWTPEETRTARMVRVE
jgi:hypothetical protein